MCYFENDYFLNILKTYKEKTFPMLVPIIVDLAENHWHKILQESLIALKTILKEIDPLAFDEALKMNPNDKKQYAVKQDDDDRKTLDKKWDKLNGKIKGQNVGFMEPALPF
jgi:serine/threonine-protein phosphatase 2A regulatory subunit B'